jgi:hypothetical protein
MIEKIYPNLTLLEGTPINLQSDKKDLVNSTLVQDRFSVRIEERPSEVVW